jgi:hypothetical protein
VIAKEIDVTAKKPSALHCYKRKDEWREFRNQEKPLQTQRHRN